MGQKEGKIRRTLATDRANMRLNFFNRSIYEVDENMLRT